MAQANTSPSHLVLSLLQLSSFHWSRLVKSKPRHDLLLNVSDRLPRSRAVNGIIHSSQTLNFQACLIQALNLHVSSCILHDLLDLPRTCCLMYHCLKVHKASKLPCEAVFCEGNTGNIRKPQSPRRSKSSSQNVFFSFAFSLVTRLLFEPSLEGVQQTFRPCWLWLCGFAVEGPGSETHLVIAFHRDQHPHNADGKLMVKSPPQKGIPKNARKQTQSEFARKRQQNVFRTRGHKLWVGASITHLLSGNRFPSVVDTLSGGAPFDWQSHSHSTLQQNPLSLVSVREPVQKAFSQQSLSFASPSIFVSPIQFISFGTHLVLSSRIHPFDLFLDKIQPLVAIWMPIFQVSAHGRQTSRRVHMVPTW